MKIKPILYIAIAFGLLSLSHSLSLRGDLAVMVSARLGYHVMALLVLLGALGLFISAGIGLVRGVRDLTR